MKIPTQNSINSTNDIEIETKKPKIIFAADLFLSIVFIFILAGIISSAIVFYAYITLNQIDTPKERRINLESKQFSSPPVFTPTPIPTPLTIDISSYKISILNGSTSAGAAAKVKELLETKGFNVPHIANATRKDLEKTLIRSKNTVPQEVLEKIKIFLSNLYTLIEGETLDDTYEFDVEITVGNIKIPTPTPTLSIGQ